MAVRREKVVLDLEDRFSSPMLRAAAAAKTLDGALNDLDGSTTRTDRDMDKLGGSSGSLSKAATQSRALNREIDRTSGRLRLFADVAAMLGPALVPIGAVAIPAVTALATQFGAAALAGGTMLIAFQGIGDTLKAVNTAALEPTADNLEAARIAMQGLAPEAREMVRQIQEMRPAFEGLRNAAAAGLFPGLTSALDEMQSVFPNIERILFRVGEAAAGLGEDLAESLTGARGQEFLSFIEAEMPRALTQLGHTVGNLAAGMGELWMAFTPLNRDATGWLLDASRGFDEWAQGLAKTQGFQDFVAYIRENGPRVADAMGAIGNAFVQIVTAAAPLGGPTLAALEAVADVIAAVAGSGAGPALIALASGLALVSRSIKTIQAIKASDLFTNLAGTADDAGRKLTGMQRAAVGAAAALASFAVIDALQGGLKDYTIGVESMTSALLDLDGAAAAGLPSNLDGIANSIDRLANPNKAEAIQDSISNALGGIGNEEEYDKAIAQIESLDSALAGLVSSGQSDVAAGALRGLNLSESQMRDLMSLLPQYKDALAGAENQARLTGDAASAAGRRAAQGFDQATSAAQRFKAAIAAANRVLEGRSSMRDFEQAIDDFTKSVRQNGRSLDINTQKGRDNQAALDAIAQSALGVAENMRGSNRVEFLKSARKDMVDAATKLGMNEAKARDLADKLLGLDKIRANPQVDVDTSGAQGKIQSVQSWLDSIQDEIVYVDVVRRSRGVQKYAAGGTVDGPRYPYRDQVLTMLAPGEEVISNRHGQADRNRALLKAINANRYANGGTVAPNVTVGSPNVNVGGTSVGVYIDGQQFRGIVRSEIAAHAAHVERQNDRD